MTPREHLINVLLGPTVARIRFTFPNSFGGRSFINAAAFMRVANAIKHKHIHVEMTNDLPEGAGGSYSQDDNTFYLQSVLGRRHEGILVHESAHAFFDLMRIRLSANDNEAAAYVAGALYFRMTNLPEPRWTRLSSHGGGPVVEKLLQEYQRGNVPVPPVDPHAWNSLKGMIMINPIYNKPDANSAGVLGVLRKAEYTADG